MDRAIVERAVRALAALNASRGIDTRFAPTQVLAPETEVEESEGGEIAACGSWHCAGCYEVGPGIRIHPPKCGEGYRARLERWETRGKPQ
jgi:hypothetical protein